MKIATEPELRQVLCAVKGFDFLLVLLLNREVFLFLVYGGEAFRFFVLNSAQPPPFTSSVLICGEPEPAEHLHHDCVYLLFIRARQFFRGEYQEEKDR